MRYSVKTKEEYETLIQYFLDHGVPYFEDGIKGFWDPDMKSGRIQRIDWDAALILDMAILGGQVVDGKFGVEGDTADFPGIVDILHFQGDILHVSYTPTAAIPAFVGGEFMVPALYASLQATGVVVCPSVAERTPRTQKRPISVIDVETTGVDTDTCRIVQICIKEMDDLGDPFPVTILSCHVNPGVPIPAGATKVHGITDDNVRRCLTFAELAEEIKGVLTGTTLCAFNLPYDWAVLRAEFKRAGVDWDMPLSGHDPLVYARAEGSVTGRNRLSDVCDRNCIELEPHDAVADATATAELLYAYSEKGVDVSVGTTAREGAKQEEELERYFQFLEVNSNVKTSWRDAVKIMEADDE